jgi:hypothetical protein
MGGTNGFGPEEIEHAYSLSPEGGSGRTVAIVIAYNYPKAEQDLGTYRSSFGLSACTTENGCFKKVNQSGNASNYPSANASWSEEAALDLDMVSAACPKCHILLVEANDASATSLYQAVQKASEMGPTVISSSWGGPEAPNNLKTNNYFHHPGIPVVFASGDSGYRPSYPASSPEVVAVGGTNLYEDSKSPRGWTEEAISIGGSGCSAYQPKPIWQKDTDCPRRTLADVAAVAAGVLSFDSERASGPEWQRTGGTSASAPVVAGIVAMKSQAFREGGAKSFYEAGEHHELYDVLKGSNGSCNASYLCEADGGYDGPSGNGTLGGPLPGPAASSQPASALEPEEATLNGGVNPYGVQTTYQFEYGTTTSYGSKFPSVPASAGSKSEMTGQSQAISGLKPSQLYHYRLAASNSAGTSYSKDRSFTTPAVNQPILTTNIASNIGSNTVTLNGYVDPHGSATSYQFEYGEARTENGEEAQGYEFTLPITGQKLGTKAGEVSQTLTGLLPNSEYHFRLRATNDLGATVYGANRFFTTLPGPPVIAKVGTELVQSLRVRFGGWLARGGEGTSWHLEYGPSPAYGKTTEVTTDASIDIGKMRIFGYLESLKPNTVYHYRLVAESPRGNVSSEDRTFTTREWDQYVAKSKWEVYPEDVEVYEPALLTATSCVTSSACFAAGYYSTTAGVGITAPLIDQRTTSGSWNSRAVIKPEKSLESGLEGISCGSASSCMAVGYSLSSSTHTMLTLSYVWNGTEWLSRATPNPSGASSSRLEGISCSSATSCMAVGHYVDGSGMSATLAEKWNGTKWELQTPLNPSGAVEASLHDVSCAAPSDCWSVGESKESGKETISLVEHWNGSAWTIQSLPEPAKSLTSVSCPSASWCMAVGDGLTTERWNGSTWLRQTASSIGQSPMLKTIFCRNQGACTAVGAYQSEGVAVALAEHWDGSEWTIQSTPDPWALQFEPPAQPATLEGVSCESAGGCTAVGGVYGESGNVLPLLESHSAVPRANAEAASAVSSTAATLNASVNPNGDATTYQFEYGSTTAYGTSAPVPAKEIGSGAKAIEINLPVMGLEVNKTYHYRVVAQNSFGAAQSEDETFTTLAPCKGTGGKCEWKTQSSPDLSHSEYSLAGVSCAGASMCMGVGKDSLAETGNAELWNGTSWVNKLTLGDSVSGVSCSSTSWCMSVGVAKGSVRAFRLKEEGGTWSAEGYTPPTPSGGSKAALSSVSCNATTACTAVGSYYVESEAKYKPLVERWNGTSWSTQSAPNPPSGSAQSAMLAVSCSTSTSCVTAGTANSAPFAETWNGTTWSVSTTAVPSPSIEATLEGISCTSSTACTAVGSYKESSAKGNYKKLLAERWNGSSWSIQTTPSPSEAKGPVKLRGVSCASATACTAVGSYAPVASENPIEQRTLTESWNGTSWSVQSSPNSAQKVNGLSAVSCSATGACTGVGIVQPEAEILSKVADRASLAERWNGISWSVQTTPAQSRSPYSLSKVSCASASICWAVGADEYAGAGVGELWNGSTWTKQTSLGSAASDVACPTTSWCAVIGTALGGGSAQAWRLKEEGGSWNVSSDTPPTPSGGSKTTLRSISCSSSTACTAVGTYYLESEGKTKLLIERWNGSSWSLQEGVNPTEKGFYSMRDVSCANSTSCLAVGNYASTGTGNEPAIAERWNGSSWSTIAPLSPGSAETTLESVSCTQSSPCMAVGSYEETGKGQYKKPLAERWNGSEWTLASMPSPSEAKGDVTLPEVSCTTAVVCSAVGQYSPEASGGPSETRTLAEYWDGAKWVVQPSPNSSQKISGLSGVSCVSAILCTAVGSGQPALTTPPVLNQTALVERYE